MDHESSSERLRLGMLALMAFVFLAYSRVSDLLVPGLNLPLITSIAALGALIASGRAALPFGTQSGRYLAAFTVWMVLAVPFSFWRGGSLEFLRTVWLKSFMVFVLIAGLVRGGRDCRRLMFVLGVAGLTVAAFALAMGATDRDGRLILPTGVLANSNDLGMLLLLLLPFSWLLMREARIWLLRIVTGIGTLVILASVLATGSRGSLLALLAMLLTVVLWQGWSRRIALAVAATIACVVGVAVAPESLLQRYATIVSSTTIEESESWVVAGAVGSAQARLQLLRQSLKMTAQRPVFGWGPGVYQAAEAVLADQQGLRGAWHESHNSYTQVSSEAGVPALFFYACALFVPMVAIRRLRSAKGQCVGGLTSSMVNALYLSFVGFAVGSLFNSVAYSYYMPTLVGLAEAVRASAQVQVSPVHARSGRSHG